MVVVVDSHPTNPPRVQISQDIALVWTKTSETPEEGGIYVNTGDKHHPCWKCWAFNSTRVLWTLRLFESAPHPTACRSRVRTAPRGLLGLHSSLSLSL